MSDLIYKCEQCGKCCYDVEGGYNKRIPLYPQEVDKLIEVAKSREIPFQVVEDLVFPDILNKKILVLTYRILLNNPKKRCPFYEDDIGCTVHEIKPLSCQAYPLSIKQEDAFNFKISIDPYCKFVDKHYDIIKKSSKEMIERIFKNEYKNAEKHLKKNKKLILKIKELEYKKKIEIARKISINEFDKMVASYMMIKKGYTPIFLSFVTSSTNTDLMRKKLIKIVKRISNFSEYKLKLYLISHIPNLEVIKRECPRKLTCVLCKRLMIRFAKTIGKKEHTNLILTGDILGEQASQTLANLFSYHNLFKNYIKISPLIGFNKMDVININKKIDEVLSSEQNYDYNKLISKALEKAEILEF
ncbi:MAG: YkgJ family cysteine cluster protein [Candidatus Lokiarchaeota archaeon]